MLDIDRELFNTKKEQSIYLCSGYFLSSLLLKRLSKVCVWGLGHKPKPSLGYLVRPCLRIRKFRKEKEAVAQWRIPVIIWMRSWFKFGFHKQERRGEGGGREGRGGTHTWYYCTTPFLLHSWNNRDTEMLIRCVLVGNKVLVGYVVCGTGWCEENIFFFYQR